jgi:c(7)-type cytochrome triheme protein
LISLNKWMLFRRLRHYSAHCRSRFRKVGGAILATIFLLGVPLTAVYAQGNDQDYSKFLHTSSKHAAIGCNECHRRADNSSRPSFPGHKACTSCHLTQFTTPTLPMCSICHQSVNGNDPPRKAFPDKFKESFNMKFDHAQHMTGSARPKNGCIGCHSGGLRRGAALSIPAGMGAHDGCYTCHTPNATANGRDLASCGVCHATKAYARTPTDSPAYRIGFSHAEHSTRQRLECASCHNYTAGLPQRRQVSSTRAQQHFPTGNNSCATCHNGRRSFGGDLDFKACRRCHEGSSFRTG